MNPRKEIKKIHDYVITKVNQVGLRDVSKVYKATLHEKVFDLQGMCDSSKPNICGYSIYVKSVYNFKANDIGVHVSIKEHWREQQHAIVTVKLLTNDSIDRHTFLLNQIIKNYINLAMERGLIRETIC